jgi:hypothetical protein
MFSGVDLLGLTVVGHGNPERKSNQGSADSVLLNAKLGTQFSKLEVREMSPL